jgi:hypothetical protein
MLALSASSASRRACRQLHLGCQCGAVGGDLLAFLGVIQRLAEALVKIRKIRSDGDVGLPVFQSR